MSESIVFKQARNYLSNLPVGSIVAWHKALINSKNPAISFPPGWVACDGQVIDDPESLLYGSNAPDLNGVTTGKSLFLRGGAESGIVQNDQVQVHAHLDAGHAHYGDPHYHVTPGVDQSTTGSARGFMINNAGNAAPPEVASNNVAAKTQSSAAQIGDPVDSKTTGAEPVRAGNETRPANMSVVWMMKVRQIADVPVVQAMQSDPQAPTGVVFVDKNGNVGIGSISPATKLHVKGDLTVSGALKGEPNLGLYLANSLTISPNGNVGVGTNLPSSRLHVNGDLTVNGAIRAEPNKSLNLADILNISPNGNVGVGTNLPASKLHVNGDLTVSGVIRPEPNKSLNLGDILSISPNGNVGVGTTVNPGRLELRGQFVRNVQMVTGLGPNDETDNGRIVSRTLVFNKIYSDTHIRILYCDNIRVYNPGGPASGQWQIRINGSAPPSGQIYQDFHLNCVNQLSNLHMPVTILGYAGGLGSGKHEIQVWVGPCSYGWLNDLWTGWSNSRWTIEAQEVWI